MMPSKTPDPKVERYVARARRIMLSSLESIPAMMGKAIPEDRFQIVEELIVDIAANIADSKKWKKKDEAIPEIREFIQQYKNEPDPVETP